MVAILHSAHGVEPGNHKSQMGWSAKTHSNPLWSSSSCSFFFFFVYLFIYGCVGSSFLWGLSLVAASGGHSSSQCAGLSLSRPLLLRSTGSRRTGSVIVVHGPSCSTACGIFPDQGSNLCPLHWQADSQPLRHQGSPSSCSFKYFWHAQHPYVLSACEHLGFPTKEDDLVPTVYSLVLGLQTVCSP